MDAVDGYDAPPTEREQHLIFDLTHCAFTLVEGMQGSYEDRLFRCTLYPVGHQGGHHRIGDSHMQEVGPSWGDYLNWKEAWLVRDDGSWLSVVEEETPRGWADIRAKEEGDG